MNLKKLQSVLISGRIIFPVCVILFIAFRLLSNHFIISSTEIITLLLRILTAVLLLHINRIFNIIRERTALPAVLFLIFMETVTETALRESIVTIAMSLCLILSFQTYQIERSQKYAFNISIILSLISLIWYPAILFVLYFTISFYQSRSLNVKSFFAFLLGIFVILMFFFCWSIYKNNFWLIPETVFSFLSIQNLVTSPHISLSNFPWGTYASSVFMLTLTFIASFNFFLKIYQEKIKTRTFIKSLIHLAIFSLIGFTLVSEGKTNFFCIVYIPASFLVSHYFTLSKNKLACWLLIFTIIYYLGIYCWNLYNVLI